MRVARNTSSSTVVTDLTQALDRGQVAALLLTQRGTLVLRRNRYGRLYADVVGFECREGLDLLSDIGGQVEDIASEVVVMTDPAAYGLPVGADGPARFHRRRS